MPEALDRIAELAPLVDVPIQVDGGVGEDNAAPCGRPAHRAPRRGERRLRRSVPGGRVPAPRSLRAVSLERAPSSSSTARRGRVPNPTVGAVVVAADGTVAGEGVLEPAGGRTRRSWPSRQPALRQRGATLYVTMEPCAHHGLTPPCVDAIVAAGIARVVAGCSIRAPRREGGRGRCAGQASTSSSLDLRDARLQNEAWRTWVSRGRPYVALRLAVSVDGRAVVPGRRWVTGEAARSRVHELRAEVDAVAVGMGTVRADAPRLDARDVGAVRQPRRLAFGRGPLPEGVGARAPDRPARRGARRARRRGVQSLLLEGGPTIGASFLAAGLVDRLLVFVAPVLAGGRTPDARTAPEPIDPRRRRSSGRRRRAARRDREASRPTSDTALPEEGVRRRRGSLGWCSPGSCARWAGRRGERRRRRGHAADRAPATAPTTAVGDSVSIGGVCLTAEAVDGGTIRLPRGSGDARAVDARAARGRATRSTSSRRSGPASRSAATSSRGTSTASARCGRSRARGRGAGRVRGAAGAPPVLRREGVDHRRRRLADDRSARRRTPSRSRSSRTRSP